jgi:hypothetical protein
VGTSLADEIACHPWLLASSKIVLQKRNAPNENWYATIDALNKTQVSGKNWTWSLENAVQSPFYHTLPEIPAHQHLLVGRSIHPNVTKTVFSRTQTHPSDDENTHVCLGVCLAQVLETFVHRRYIYRYLLLDANLGIYTPPNYYAHVSDGITEEWGKNGGNKYKKRLVYHPRPSAQMDA